MPPTERARPARWRVAAEVLAEVRREPGITRAAIAQRLGISSGVATEVTARLREARLVTEVEAASSGRGRPSAALRAHPEGPLVLVAEVRQEGWRVAVAALDGALIPIADGRNPADPEPDQVLAQMSRAARRAVREFAGRIRAVSVSVPGVVVGTVLRQASGLGWEDVDLAGLGSGVVGPLLVGNDATLAGVAEVRAGAATGATTALHLQVEESPGGALVVDGRPVSGATGAAGEFGHMPFGDRRVRCACGARGCWGTAVGARALAAALGESEPVDPRALARRVRAGVGKSAGVGESALPGAALPEAALAEEALAEAVTAQAVLAQAVGAQSALLGTGLAALVNALDPVVVTIGGIAIALRASAPEAFAEAYDAGLMRYRRTAPPPVRDSLLGDDGALLGAAAVGLDVVASPESLAAWADQWA